jgi:pimeloyl-ACP methyl ester carboxylesterase
VITEAGSHPAVAHLVYLAALALDARETCATAAAGEAAAARITHDGRPNLGAGFVIDADGIVTLTRSVAAECLYHDCDEQTMDWALNRLGGQPLLTFQQTPGEVAWRTTPSTYVACARDRAVHPDLQRLLAKRCTSRVEWECGHSPFLSHPDMVAGLVAKVVDDTLATTEGHARSD